MDKIVFLNGPKVRLELSPEDWCLSPADSPEKDQERDMIAETLNKQMADLIAECPKRSDIYWLDLQNILGPYRKWGVGSLLDNDTVGNILDTVYGDI